MSTARLTASLLAPKGTAFPLGNAYANPHLDPLPARREARLRPSRPDAGHARCRVEAALHTRLRILAARQGRSVRALVESALAGYLATNGADCPCLGAASRKGGELVAEGACCQGTLGARAARPSTR
jgi:plasmid stability protein